MVAVTAAIGLLLHSIEVNAYSQKEQQLQDELKQVAETAADLLVSNPDIVCELMNNSESVHIAYLENCIPKINAGPRRINKAKMGIPDGFGCKIDKEGPELQTDGCEKGPLSDDIENIYSTTRQIVSPTQSNKKTVTKEQLEICMGNVSGTCDLIEDTVTLWVWKT